MHELTESYYDYVAEQFDAVAERILQMGEKPLTTLKEYLENATLKEEPGKDFEPSYIVEQLLNDFCTLKNDYNEISELANQAGDTTTAALADDNVAWLEKAIWMLKATQK